MRKILACLLLAGFLIAMSGNSARAASEEPGPDGQVIKSYIDVAYFQVWKHSDGRWQDTDGDGIQDVPGQTKTWSYEVQGVLEPLGQQWNITGVRVRYLANGDWSEALFQQAGSYNGMSFSDFKEKILRYVSAEGSEGRVWAEENPSSMSYTLHYEDIRLAPYAGVSDVAAAKTGAMDLKWPENQAFLDSLGIPLKTPTGGIARMAEGYNYWLPYIVEIYGTPKEKPPAVPQPQPTDNFTDNFVGNLDGAFLDWPVREGEDYKTTVIRVPRFNQDKTQTYHIRVEWQLYNGIAPYRDILESKGIVDRKVLFDEDVTFNEDNKAWVKEFIFPAPGEGQTSVLKIIEGDILDVYQSISSNGSKSTYTRAEGMPEGIIPWDWITQRYGIAKP